MTLSIQDVIGQTLIAAVWEEARKSRGSRKRFFEHIRTITAYLLFPSRQALMRTILTGAPPPQPTIIAIP